jgi:hypothetical protein
MAAAKEKPEKPKKKTVKSSAFASNEASSKASSSETTTPTPADDTPATTTESSSTASTTKSTTAATATPTNKKPTKPKGKKKRRIVRKKSEEDSVASGSSYYHYDSDSSISSSGSELSLLKEDIKNPRVLKGVAKEASRSSLLDSASLRNGCFLRSYLSSDEDDDSTGYDEDAISELDISQSSVKGPATTGRISKPKIQRVASTDSQEKIKSKAKDKAEKKEKRKKDKTADAAEGEADDEKDIDKDNKKKAEKKEKRRKEKAANAAEGEADDEKDNHHTKDKDTTTIEKEKKADKKEKRKKDKSSVLDNSAAEAEEDDATSSSKKHSKKNNKSSRTEATRIRSTEELEGSTSSHHKKEEPPIIKKAQLKKHKSAETRDDLNDDDDDDLKGSSDEVSMDDDDDEDIIETLKKQTKKEKSPPSVGGDTEEMTTDSSSTQQDTPSSKKKSKEKGRRKSLVSTATRTRRNTLDDQDLSDDISTHSRERAKSFLNAIRRQNSLRLTNSSSSHDRGSSGNEDIESIKSMDGSNNDVVHLDDDKPETIHIGPKSPKNENKVSKSPKKSSSKQKKSHGDQSSISKDLLPSALLSPPLDDPLLKSAKKLVGGIKSKKQTVTGSTDRSEESAKSPKKKKKDKVTADNEELSAIIADITPKLEKLLDDPKTYDDEAMVAFLQEYPQSASIKFELGSFSMRGCAGSSNMYLLSMLCSVGASRETLSLCYDLYPDAIQDDNEWSGTPLHYAIVCGIDASFGRGTSTDFIFQMLEYLLEKEPLLLQSQTNHHSQSVLHKTVTALCSSTKGAPKKKSSKTSSENSSGRGKSSKNSQLAFVASEVVSLLLEYHPPLAKLRDRDDLLPLHLAAQHAAPLDILDRILKANIDACTVACKNRGYTPLHCAAEAVGGAAKAILIKVSSKKSDGKNNDDEDKDYSRAFSSLQTHLCNIKALIEASPSAGQVPDNAGSLPLHVVLRASKNDDGAADVEILKTSPRLFVKVLEMLTRAFPDAANTPDSKEETPLMIAEEREASDEIINAISLL